MKFPATRIQLHEAGYRFKFARNCKLCKKPLEFYQTPTKALAPMEGVVATDGAWLMDSHFKTCEFRDQFKKPAAEKKPEKQRDLFEEKA